MFYVNCLSQFLLQGHGGDILIQLFQGPYGVVQLDSCLQGWILIHWPILSGGHSPRQWSHQHLIFSLFLLTGDLSLPDSQQGAELESSALLHVELYSLFFPWSRNSECLCPEVRLGAQRPVALVRSLPCFTLFLIHRAVYGV